MGDKSMLGRLIAALCLVAVAACATASADEPVRPNYYVVRHLQKATGDDPGLTAEGQRNAARLADLLADDPPSSIYVSSTRRARETAAVLAGRLGLTPKIYDPRDTPALIAAVTAETGTVLIVGHSNTVPEIVERLGGTRPADLSESDYGDVWRVYGPDRRVERMRVGGE
jgi:broad specificity phosphatase PhoE